MNPKAWTCAMPILAVLTAAGVALIVAGSILAQRLRSACHQGRRAAPTRSGQCPKSASSGE